MIFIGFSRRLRLSIRTKKRLPMKYNRINSFEMQFNCFAVLSFVV